MVSTLIQICRVQWWCPPFLLLIGNKLFWGKFDPKSQDYQFKLKFGTKTNSNMQNATVRVIFSVFACGYDFWANLVQNVKIVSWRWNLIHKLIQLCRIQWWCSLLLFLVGIPCLGQFGLINQNCQLKVKLDTWFEYAEFNDAVQFFCFGTETPFLDKFGPNCQYLLLNVKLDTLTNSIM